MDSARTVESETYVETSSVSFGSKDKCEFHELLFVILVLWPYGAC